MKKLSKQTLDSEFSVCMAAIFYNGAISAAPTNEQLVGKKRSCPKFPIDILKNEGLVAYRYTDGQTEEHG